MKTRAWVSCLLSGYWVLACGAEAPPDEPPEPTAPDNEVSVIATAEAVSAAAATNGSGGTSANGGSATGNSGSSGTRATAVASSTSAAADTSATGGASAADGTASDASTTSQPGTSGAAGASAATEGTGGGSAGAGASAGTEPTSETSGASEDSGGAESTTGEELPPPPIPLGALLITEYVESGGDKAIEISNLGPDTLSLAECRLETYFNGNLESTSGVDLDGVELAPEQSWVLCNSGPNQPLLDACDQPSSLNFNGNDALVLRCNAAVHDSFGQVGGPGKAWQSSAAADGASYSSEDHVLRRRCGALPRTDPTMPFEPALTADWVSIWQIEGVITTAEQFEGIGQSACAEPAPADDTGEGGAAAGGTAGSASE